MGATHIAMLPARFFVIARLMRLEVITYLLTNHTSIYFECHIVIPAKSHIDFPKNTTGIQLRETNSSATTREYV